MGLKHNDNATHSIANQMCYYYKRSTSKNHIIIFTTPPLNITTKLSANIKMEKSILQYWLWKHLLLLPFLRKINLNVCHYKKIFLKHFTAYQLRVWVNSTGDYCIVQCSKTIQTTYPKIRQLKKTLFKVCNTRISVAWYEKVVSHFHLYKIKGLIDLKMNSVWL